MYIYIYIYIYVCVCVCVCVCVYMCVYIYVHMCIYVYTLSNTTLITLIILVQYRNTDGQHIIVPYAMVFRKFKENANNRTIFSQFNYF